MKLARSYPNVTDEGHELQRVGALTVIARSDRR